MNRSYRYFLMVSQVGSIKKASERLHVTQPTLTTAIKKLEAEVGVPLLIRRSKGVELTDYGKLFAQYVEEQQDKHVDLLHKLQDMQQRELGKLKLGVGEAWWELFVRGAIEQYQHSYPESSLYIEFGNNLSLMQHLIQGDIDLFVGHEVIGLHDRHPVTFKPLFQDLETYYVSGQHPLSKQSKLSLDLQSGVTQYPILKVTPSHSRYSPLLSDALSNFDNGTENTISYEVDSLPASIDILNMTNAIMPYTSKMESWMQERGVIALKPENEKVGNVGIYHKRSLSDPKVELLIDLIEQIQRD